jgi:hypothetical protein
VEPQVADCDDLEIGTLVRFAGTRLYPESDIGIVIKIHTAALAHLDIEWIRDGRCQHSFEGMDDAFYHGHMEIVK